MNGYPDNTQKKLAEIFGKINLSDLPAMSDNVGELLALTNNRRVTAEELASVILKDYSLTNKVLQVVNSAYYNRGVPVRTIERAVTILGIDMVRELATTIALFDEFVRSGIEKEGISKLLCQSYLSACLSKAVCELKRLNASPEEAYICALLHNLGKTIILLYLPDVYRKIMQAVASGGSEDAMTRLILKKLTFAEVGMEVARFWNFADPIILSMNTAPPEPEDQFDSIAYLQNLAVFSNRLVMAICEESDFSEVMLRYGAILSITLKEALQILQKSLENADNISTTIRYGLTRLKFQSRLLVLQQKLNQKQ